MDYTPDKDHDIGNILQMNAELASIFHKLIERTSLSAKRYLFDNFHLDNRLTGLVGARGVGKTTLLLQYIKANLYEAGNAFYLSADHFYFNTHSLYEFIVELHQNQGIDYVFIDEIHKYQNWEQELKNLYDAYPDLRIIFSGSSMLDLVKGSYDLSRRAYLFHLPGLSFREYLNLIKQYDFSPIDFDTILDKPQAASPIQNTRKLLGHFKDYLEYGYYPFIIESQESYYQRLARMVEKTIYEDIASFYQLKTANLHHFKSILNFLASILPGDINPNHVANALALDNKTVKHYLDILSETSLIRIEGPFQGGKKQLRSMGKVFLHNTNLLYMLNRGLGETVPIGTVRELFFCQMLENSGHTLFASDIGDFQTLKAIFEIRGKNKTHKQIKAARLPAYLVKDDILIGSKNIIPLYLFGFLY